MDGGAGRGTLIRRFTEPERLVAQPPASLVGDTLWSMITRRISLLLLLALGAWFLDACANQDYVVKTPVPPPPKPRN